MTGRSISSPTSFSSTLSLLSFSQTAFFPIPELAALSPTHHGPCSRLYPDWNLILIFLWPVSAETSLPPQRSFATTFNSVSTHTVGFLHSSLLNSYRPATHFLYPFTACLSIILKLLIRPVSTTNVSPGPSTVPDTQQVWSLSLVWIH